MKVSGQEFHHGQADGEAAIIEGRGPPSPIGGGGIMTSDAEELAVLYAEFDRRFAELERLIWRIRELEENEG